MEKLVVFSGAGMSAESGLKTFRDHNGLWENYNIQEVATPEAWEKNPQLVLSFYNQRRAQLFKAKPNKAHTIVADLENFFDVAVITQNIDNLHEKAGSNNVLHLHGELMKAKCHICKNYSILLDKEKINYDDLCPKGHQLRPEVVWFGEAVPMIPIAANEIKKADILIVIGTSLNVYPAASLVFETNENCKKIVVDPKANELNLDDNWAIVNEKAEKGLETIYQLIKKGGINRLF